MAGRDGPKPVKYPERLLKVLDQRMQDIAMGKDRTYVFPSCTITPYPYQTT